VTYPKIKEDNINLKNLDFKKNLNALLPNTCHYLDSLLMYNVIKDVTKKKIPIKTIHDSFYTNIKYKSIISDIYKINYIKLFKSNLLEQIIQNALNEFSLITEFFDLLAIINKQYNQNIISASIEH
jgi:DNA-directed RNA polymerase